MTKFIFPAAIALSTIPTSIYFLSLVCTIAGRPLELF